MFISDISKEEFEDSQKVEGSQIKSPIFNEILALYPDFSKDSFLSKREFLTFRTKYLISILNSDMVVLSESVNDVLLSIQDNEVVKVETDEESDKKRTFGQRAADNIASFGGSWKFIIIFIVVLFFWIITNSLFFLKAFDPYPFILLNLFLSSIAAFQAPIILMSQIRQEEKDRERAKMDFKINLKSEIEIKLLHEKVDHLVLQLHQNTAATEIIQSFIDRNNSTNSQMT